MMFKKKYYTAQVDEQDCGVAALSMLMKAYGTSKSLASLRESAKTDMAGTTVLGIKSAAQGSGFGVQVVRADPSLFEMDHAPYPYIIHVVKNQSYPHYYLVYGVRGDKILLADPDPGVRMIKMSKKALAQEFTGVTLFIGPKPDYRPQKEKTSSLSSFIPLLMKQKKLIVHIVLAAFLVTLINIASSYYLQSIIDTYIPNGMMSTLGIVSFGLMVTYLIQQVLSFAQQFLMTILGQRLTIDVILSYLQHIFRLPMSFFATRRTGEILSRFSDANSILDALASAMMSLFLDLVMVVLTGIILGLQNLQLFFLVLVSIPVYALTLLVFVRPLEKQNKESMQANALASSTIIEDIKGIETIKALAGEENRYQKIDREFVAYLRRSLTRQKTENLQAVFKVAIQLILNVLILWAGAGLVMRGRMTLGQLMTFNALLSYFTTSLANIVNLQTKIQSARVANQRLNEVYLVAGEFDLEQPEIALNHFDLEMVGVSHQYGFGKKTLDGVGVSIKEGEKITIVGMSGSGKSTLGKLLVNFFQPSRGRITLGGFDLQNLNKGQLRRLVNYLPQEPYIFTGTIRENLLLGAREGITDMDLQFACELAAIRQDIEKMPLGFQTELSGESNTISGGQKQRIALARALLSPAKIFIFDEATSNLDVLTEKNILSGLFSMDQTVIFIAHRLSVAEKSDRVLVIEQGKLIESGSHQELMARDGFYKHLFKS